MKERVCISTTELMSNALFFCGEGVQNIPLAELYHYLFHFSQLMYCLTKRSGCVGFTTRFTKSFTRREFSVLTVALYLESRRFS